MNIFLTVVLWMIGEKLAMGSWYYTFLVLGFLWSCFKTCMGD